MIIKERLTHSKQHKTESIYTLCEVTSEGSDDIYPCLAPTVAWDTCTADAIVRARAVIVLWFKDKS